MPGMGSRSHWHCIIWNQTVNGESSLSTLDVCHAKLSRQMRRSFERVENFAHLKVMKTSAAQRLNASGEIDERIVQQQTLNWKKTLDDVSE